MIWMEEKTHKQTHVALAPDVKKILLERKARTGICLNKQLELLVFGRWPPEGKTANAEASV